MALIRLIYASVASNIFKSNDVVTILNVSRINNAMREVTGLLFFNKHFFLQCLEGEEQQVEETYDHIAKDTRHEKVTILSCKTINSRSFPNWTMGYVPQSQLTNELAQSFCDSGTFDPFAMQGDSAYELLCKLKEQVPNH
ncbi:BLUF [Pseudoalteromonas luteoviolacea B = ATCC 29581]|nr:BLUF [Pseudoalteromonas luteoviolacea B = ATCC 29581]